MPSLKKIHELKNNKLWEITSKNIKFYKKKYIYHYKPNYQLYNWIINIIIRIKNRFEVEAYSRAEDWGKYQNEVRVFAKRFENNLKEEIENFLQKN
jgi:hypothetical protein